MILIATPALAPSIFHGHDCIPHALVKRDTQDRCRNQKPKCCIGFAVRALAGNVLRSMIVVKSTLRDRAFSRRYPNFKTWSKRCAA
jgi:hypothetical protein